MNLLYGKCTILLLFCCSMLNGQTFPYIATTFMEPYEDLTDATIVVSDVWDDPEFEVPLGFDFDYYGDTFNVIYQVSLGAMMSFVPDVYGTSTNWLFAYASDLVDRGVLDNTPASPISYKTEGLPGSRICKIEWKNAGFYEEYYLEYTTSNFINFQLWLYEGSNDIEIRFGPGDLSLGASLHLFNGMPLIGMVENFNIDAYAYENLWYLTGPPNSPKVGLSTSFSELFTLNSLSGNPADSTVYRFSTGLSSAEEAIDLGAHIGIFPSLVNTDVQVVTDLTITKGSVKILNNLGQLLVEEPLEQGQQSIYMGDFVPGLYFVTVQSEGAVFTKQVYKN